MNEPAGLDFIPTESSVGRQRLPARPSSARYSTGSRLAERRTRTPGPADYEVRSCTASHQSSSSAAVFGTNPRGQLDGNRAYQYPHVDDLYAYDEGIVYPTPRSAIFGHMREARMAEVIDTDYIKQCPESRYCLGTPGPVYMPDDRRAGGKGRPRSAPSYSMPRDGQMPTPSSQRSRGPGMAPHAYGCEGAMGRQLTSKHRTSRASSFGRASRFPAGGGGRNPNEGQPSAECRNVHSTITGSSKQRRAPAASFGTATRDGYSRVAPCRQAMDRPASARLGRPSLPHPPVASMQERLRFDPASRTPKV